MLDEQPRLFFVPYWTNEDAIKRAKGLQTALQKVAIARCPPLSTNPALD
jgi:hypothetical protein